MLKDINYNIQALHNIGRNAMNKKPNSLTAALTDITLSQAITHKHITGNAQAYVTTPKGTKLESHYIGKYQYFTIH